MKYLLLFIFAVGCGDKQSEVSSVQRPQAQDKTPVSQDKKPAARSNETDDELEKLKKQIATLKAEVDKAIREGDNEETYCEDEVAAATAAIDKIQGHPDAKPEMPDNLPGDVVLPDDFDWMTEADCDTLYVDPKIRKRKACKRYKNALKRWKALLPTYYEESKQANAALETCLQARQTDSD